MNWQAIILVAIFVIAGTVLAVVDELAMANLAFGAAIGIATDRGIQKTTDVVKSRS